MSIVNGIITAPINMKDPYVCMGVGKYNGYMENGELKFNMNQIPLAEMASIVTAIANCINEIKEETV